MTTRPIGPTPSQIYRLKIRRPLKETQDGIAVLNEKIKRVWHCSEFC